MSTAVAPDSPGSLVSRLRTQHGQTQAEMARRVGVRQSLISRIERDRRKPSKRLVRQLAEAYRLDAVTVTQLLDILAA